MVDTKIMLDHSYFSIISVESGDILKILMSGFVIKSGKIGRIRDW